MLAEFESQGGNNSAARSDPKSQAQNSRHTNTLESAAQVSN